MLYYRFKVVNIQVFNLKKPDLIKIKVMVRFFSKYVLCLKCIYQILSEPEPELNAEKCCKKFFDQIRDAFSDAERNILEAWTRGGTT